AAVQVFHVRGGRVRGQRGWVIDRVEQVDLVGQFLTQFYGEQAALAGSADDAIQPVPREVLVPELPDDPEDTDALTEWLSGLRGARVALRVPQRGDKRALADTVARNAAEAFTQHKLRRAGDLTARAAALQEIHEYLGLDTAPLRIECIDVSHVQGNDVVASLVVFEDGLPRKSDYRRFAIRDAAGEGHSDDVASIAEVVRRRFARYLRENEELASKPGLDPDTGRPRKFAYPPNLLVVDGGPAQVAAAAQALFELGVTDVAIAGLAKRLEEVWLPGEADPVILPRSSEGLYLLQRVRDEAHRFAISYHRQKRSARMTSSELDSVAGLGRTRRTALLKHFGSVRRIRDASVEQLTEVPGVGPSTAKAVLAALGNTSELSSVSTGEKGNGATP
ncbi:MAG: excinuclease ABC subunit UvrC, partial [Pseudonocardiaceae bacterium]